MNPKRQLKRKEVIKYRKANNIKKYRVSTGGPEKAQRWEHPLIADQK